MTQAGDGAPEACRSSCMSDDERQRFLTTLSETSNVDVSAAAAEVSVSTVHRVRAENPDFAAAWQAALDDGYDRLELELLYRLRSGRVEEQDETGAKRKYDIATGFRILSAHRQRQQAEGGGAAGLGSEAAVIAAIDARLDELRERRRVDNAALAAAAAALQVQDDIA
ncbi:hypothetical protein V5740_12125 [Croceibacterium sp. TMG7-5b_MA50]|uniref:hypothetical protein n=1 Tax=Croceibacterium sp. TMG7-5b_MA50 TaxID=3121290 RepID=UPI00322173BE